MKPTQPQSVGQPRAAELLARRAHGTGLRMAMVGTVRRGLSRCGTSGRRPRDPHDFVRRFRGVLDAYRGSPACGQPALERSFVVTGPACAESMGIAGVVTLGRRCGARGRMLRNRVAGALPLGSSSLMSRVRAIRNSPRRAPLRRCLPLSDTSPRRAPRAQYAPVPLTRPIPQRLLGSACPECLPASRWFDTHPVRSAA